MHIHRLVKHLIHCAAYVCGATWLISFFLAAQREFNVQLEESGFDPWNEYGIIRCSFLYFTRFVVLLAIPQVVLNILGLFSFNAFNTKVTLNGSPILLPLICIRIVTRGDFPKLVRNNVMLNMARCSESGLNNILIEVITDKPIGLPSLPRIREVLVPGNYVPKSGALYKARALQYSLLDEVNVLSDNDYVVHLDEETLLTSNSIRGIMNFIFENKYDLGQGLITYANDPIVNWFTTLADCIRVADDMGKLRASFRFFHKPLLSWKGSFIVSRVGAERDISFDHGIEGSIAEDCYFAMCAYQKGYTFDFIEGEMWEKSPFTIWDFIQQRKRWAQGISLVVNASKISLKYKIWLCFSYYAWITMPLSLSSIVLGFINPLPMPIWLDAAALFIGTVKVYMYIFGLFKSISLYRLGLLKYSLCFLSILFVILMSSVLESIAVLLALFSDKRKFYIVNKDTKIIAV